MTFDELMNDELYYNPYCYQGWRGYRGHYGCYRPWGSWRPYSNMGPGPVPPTLAEVAAKGSLTTSLDFSSLVTLVNLRCRKMTFDELMNDELYYNPYCYQGWRGYRGHYGCYRPWGSWKPYSNMGPGPVPPTLAEVAAKGSLTTSLDFSSLVTLVNLRCRKMTFDELMNDELYYNPYCYQGWRGYRGHYGCYRPWGSWKPYRYGWGHQYGGHYPYRWGHGYGYGKFWPCLAEEQ
ncbi:unnamed protein product [Caretta caretta]